MHVALYQPEIPPNTGNIIRLCANSGATLHLIHPLGFAWEDKQVKRAGLDYHEFAHIHHHENFEAFLQECSHQRIFACTTKGSVPYHEIKYQPEDILLFGPETRGLPEEIRQNSHITDRIRIPMKPESRSLNLSNSVAIILYEAYRQMNFPDMVLY